MRSQKQLPDQQVIKNLKEKHAYFVKNIAHLYTPDTKGQFGQIIDLENVHLLLEDGQIKTIVQSTELLPEAEKIIDLSGKCLLPGFIDPHTHPVFWKTREDEFIMRVQGKSYEEIAAAGGGIRNSVRKFRQASKEEIKEVTRQRIARFLEFGVTTIEAKSGYGLSTADEIKSLEIINELNQEQPLEMVPTFWARMNCLTSTSKTDRLTLIWFVGR